MREHLNPSKRPLSIANRFKYSLNRKILFVSSRQRLDEPRLQGLNEPSL